MNTIKKTFLDRASECLELLRSGTLIYEEKIHLMNELLGKATDGSLFGKGSTLEDIGSSEAEIEELRIKGAEMVAKDRLKTLRNWKGGKAEGCIKVLHDYLKLCNLTLEDIGSSEAEIEELRIRCSKTTAINYLKCVRNGTYEVSDGLLDEILEHLEICNLTLEDIGSSEAEIEELRATS